MELGILGIEMNDALRRAALYRLLASAFRYPGGAGQEEIGKEFQSLLTAGAPWPGGVEPLLARSAALLQENDGDDLASAYLRLFGPSGSSLIQETAYGDNARLLGKPNNLADISGFYLAFGLTTAPGAGNSEDHLTMELEFMSLLNIKEAMALNEGWQEQLEITREVQQKFLGEHLGSWLETWHQQFAEQDSPEFYQTLAQAMLLTVNADMVRIGVTPIQLTQKLTDKELGSDELVCPMTGPADPLL